MSTDFVHEHTVLLIAFSYTNDSPELFQRKLGDLAFLVQNYEFAYNSYHTAKRDFNHEHAWFYFAGALVSEGLGGDHIHVQQLVSFSTVCKYCMISCQFQYLLGLMFEFHLHECVFCPCCISFDLPLN